VARDIPIVLRSIISDQGDEGICKKQLNNFRHCFSEFSESIPAFKTLEKYTPDASRKDS